jgi:hypothetical protein
MKSIQEAKETNFRGPEYHQTGNYTSMVKQTTKVEITAPRKYIQTTYNQFL